MVFVRFYLICQICVRYLSALCLLQMPPDGGKVCIVPSDEDVCLICLESNGIRLDKCEEYKCQCRGLFFHENCYETYKGFPCPTCRLNNNPIVGNVGHVGNVNHVLIVQIDGNMAEFLQRLEGKEAQRANEEADQLRQTKRCIYFISPILALLYILTLIYAALACGEWTTYSEYEKVTLVGVIIINVYLVLQNIYVICNPDSFFEFSNTRTNTLVQIVILFFALMAVVVYFRNPDVYYLKVATGITTGITICSLIFALMLLFCIGIVSVCC